jgi:hypothetical protein
MERLLLTCPECQRPGMLLCEMTGPLPEHLTLIRQLCQCENPEDAWPVVWEEADERLREEREP